MKNLRIKWVLRRDEIQGHIRLFRVMWETGRPGLGPNSGHSNMISVAIQPRLYLRDIGFASWMIVVLGLRIHRKRSYGGIFA